MRGPLESLLLQLAMISAVLGIDVTISIGTIRGYQLKGSSGKLVNVFKHIPYAAPPLGELRFKKPIPPKKWEGVRDGTDYGPACMSNSSFSRSPQKWVHEDCLHVNIFAGADCLKKACSVMFYIHGGDFNYDSAVMFRDEPLVNNFAANDIVLVIPGFRLGFFGLLTFDSDEVVPRNIAAYDLIAALYFVKNEIKHFGGNDITLFGHSEGATASAQFALSKTIDPDVKLFQKAVMMSMHYAFQNLSHAEDVTMEMAYRAKCSPSRAKSQSSAFVERVVKCLKNLDSMEILRIQREMEDESVRLKPELLVMTAPLFGAGNQQEFLADPPPRTIVVGSTLREMDFMYNFYEIGDIVKLLGLRNRKEIQEKVREDAVANKWPGDHSVSTQAIIMSTYVIAHKLREAGGRAYIYSYANPRHSFHTSDLAYIMGVHPFELDPNEAVLAVLYPKFFVDFMKTGQPRPDWIPLQADLDNYMHINVNLADGTMPEMRNHYEAEVINYWKEMTKYDEEIVRRKNTVRSLIGELRLSQLVLILLMVTSLYLLICCYPCSQ
ncbi:unnamed protein product [Cylicocyclus nassatus]|uniref:Carboxylesterase type B domain-containing protein n=1 Tax=Cylicocyclus nassatus TaxID=53992 RepID=A0AA36DV17_CYLNA|nr:unnamed protein product [Cylicocyclus nassatus]